MPFSLSHNKVSQYTMLKEGVCVGDMDIGKRMAFGNTMTQSKKNVWPAFRAVITNSMWGESSGQKYVAEF